jgi:protein involved in polysaccharide export with SLBB domain
MGKNLVISVSAPLMILISFGCATTQQTAQQHPSAVSTAVPVNSVYTIHPGDTLDIKFFYNPELNETVVVRPDGFISLQLVDEVKAAGLEPKKLTQNLTELYSRDLKKPVVTVIVKSFEGQRVYVGGEVNQQGLITMPAGLTALQAVMQAGGLKVTAQPSEILVIRKGPDRRPVPIKVNLEALLEGDGNGSDFRLQSEDIVFVPKSPIAKANQFVNQYVEQLLLFRGVSFGFSYVLNEQNNN